MNRSDGRGSGQNHDIIDVDKHVEKPGFQCPICLAYSINALLAAQHEARCRTLQMIGRNMFGGRVNREGFAGQNGFSDKRHY